MKPLNYLSSDTINYFTELVTNKKRNYAMVDVSFYPMVELYNPFQKQADDVQILYGGKAELNAVGHWICIFYKWRTKTVHVYDSLMYKELNAQQMKIVQRLYPNHKNISFEEPKTTQKDLKSCGVFSIAYATSLILGYDPQAVNYELDTISTDSALKMRNHIKKMFEAYELSEFPKVKINNKQ